MLTHLLKHKFHTDKLHSISVIDVLSCLLRLAGNSTIGITVLEIMKGIMEPNKSLVYY